MAEKKYNAKYKSVKKSLKEMTGESSGASKKQKKQIDGNILKQTESSEESCYEYDEIEDNFFTSQLSNYESTDLSSDLDIYDENIPEKPVENIISTDVNSNDNFKKILCSWAKDFSVNQTQLNSLLKGLNTHLRLGLPSDARTLLGTVRQSNITEMSTSSGKQGEFCYLGIGSNLKKFLSSQDIRCKVKQELKLIFNVDGVPLSRSSNRQFWPLLGKLWVSNLNIISFSCCHFLRRWKTRHKQLLL